MADTNRWRRFESSSDISRDKFHATPTSTTAQARRRPAQLRPGRSVAASSETVFCCCCCCCCYCEPRSFDVVLVHPGSRNVAACVRACLSADASLSSTTTARTLPLLEPTAHEPPSLASGYSGTAPYGTATFSAALWRLRCADTLNFSAILIHSSITVSNVHLARLYDVFIPYHPASTPL